MKVFCSSNVLKCFIFIKNHILSNLFVKQKQYKPSSCRHFVSATCFWFLLPLTTLVVPNGMIAPNKTNELGQFKEKVEQISFRKYYRCDALRVADLKFNLATSCENLHYVNCDQQRRRSACLCSLSSIQLFASLLAGYLPMLKPA